METLTINIPDKKSTLVKQILTGLGVIIQSESSIKPSDYKKKLASVSTWTKDDLKVFDESSRLTSTSPPVQVSTLKQAVLTSAYIKPNAETSI